MPVAGDQPVGPRSNPSEGRREKDRGQRPPRPAAFLKHLRQREISSAPASIWIDPPGSLDRIGREQAVYSQIQLPPGSRHHASFEVAPRPRCARGAEGTVPIEDKNRSGRSGDPLFELHGADSRLRGCRGRPSISRAAPRRRGWEAGKTHPAPRPSRRDGRSQSGSAGSGTTGSRTRDRAPVPAGR